MDISRSPTLTPVKGAHDFRPLKAAVEAVLQREVALLEQRLQGNPRASQGAQLLGDFLRRPGKRLRPLLLLQTWMGLTGRKPDEKVLGVAASLEFFHNFTLIHDDVIDRSVSRRGQPTLHRRIEKAFGISGERAHNLAIVLGDCLFGFAVEIFTENLGSRDPDGEALRYFLRSIQCTGQGQYLELVNLDRNLPSVEREEILRTYYLKTTHYTFETPLVLAAQLSGQKEWIGCFQQLAAPLGFAFQLQNDLHELHLPPDQAAELAYDLLGGVKTLFLKDYYEEAGPDRKQSLDLLLSGRTLDHATLTALLDDFRASEAFQHLNDKVHSLFREADEVLARQSLRTETKEALQGIVHSLRRLAHHSESTGS